MRFEWDQGKACSNLRKHGVAFEDAVLVWSDPLHLLRFDRADGSEERWHVLGTAGGVVILLVAHTHPEVKTARRYGSSVHDGQRRQNEGPTKMAIPEQQRERLKHLAAASDAEIDTSDIPEILDWSGAVRAGLHGPRKTTITIRLDADVLAWFKAASENGTAYQSEINRVLRHHMERAAKPPERA